MKVLGTAERQRTQGYGKEQVFIVEITMDEIAKVANKSAYRDGDSLSKMLQPGMDYPISEGYDFKQEIVVAVSHMTEAHKKFAAATTTMTRFVRTLPQPGQHEGEQE